MSMGSTVIVEVITVGFCCAVPSNVASLVTLKALNQSLLNNVIHPILIWLIDLGNNGRRNGSFHRELIFISVFHLLRYLNLRFSQDLPESNC